MSIEILPYVVALMIVYDLSIHLVYLLNKDEQIIKKRINWWGIKYQIFWITYWLTALILLIIYITIK